MFWVTGDLVEGCYDLQLTVQQWIYEGATWRSLWPADFCHQFKGVEEMYSLSDRVTVKLSYNETSSNFTEPIDVDLLFIAKPLKERPGHEVEKPSKTAGNHVLVIVNIIVIIIIVFIVVVIIIIIVVVVAVVIFASFSSPSSCFSSSTSAAASSTLSSSS